MVKFTNYKFWYIISPFTDTTITVVFVKRRILYMKATGIVRRIDDLGRVVVPKEIRRTLRIREGDPMEIFTAKEGEVVLKKYSPMGEMGSHAEEYAKAMAQVTDMTVIITDRDQIIAAAGKCKREYANKNISQMLEEVMEEREVISTVTSDKRKKPIVENENVSEDGQVIYPIICHGDVIGVVGIISKDDPSKMSSSEERIAQVAAMYLGQQMES